MSEYSANKAVVDKLWQIAANAEKGVSSYWISEQIKWLAHEIEPQAWWPRNTILDRVAMGTEDATHD